MNNLKGRISENVIRDYIKTVTLPKLKKQCDHLLYGHRFGFIQKDPKNNNKLFIENGLYPSEELINKLIPIGQTFYYEPDGFIYLLKDTGHKITLREALEESDLSGFLNGFWSGTPDFKGREHDPDEKLPIVDGEVQVIEVKSDKGKMRKKQLEQYKSIVKQGVVFRYYHVKILSFVENKYDVIEKVIQDPSEISYRIIGD